MILAFDLATKLCGWAAGDGSRRPVAGAFELTRRDDPGELADEFKGHFLDLREQFAPTHYAVERPLLTSTDVRWTVERLMGLWFFLHGLVAAVKCGPCIDIDQDEAKREWGGRHGLRRGGVLTDAQLRREGKKRMVEMCDQLRIDLPATEAAGRFDAADACGIWKVALRKTKSPHSPAWDSAVMRRRGSFL